MNIKKALSKSEFSINTRILMVFSFVLALALSAGYIFMEFTNKNLDKLSAASEESQRAPNIDIIVLKDQTCAECFDVKPFVEAVKKQKVSVTSEKEVDTSSDEGKSLIAKYAIAKIPTVIISGEVEKDAALKDYFSKVGEIKEGSFILKSVGNPYIAAATGELKGKVDVILISDKSCKECFDPNLYATSLKTQLGMIIETQDNVDVSSAEGKTLISKNAIEGVPALIITGDLESYPVLSQIGNVKDGIFTLKKVNAPYREIATGKIRGLVDSTVIADKSCADCYDVKNYDQLFANYGIKFRDSKILDAADAEGDKTIKKYNITILPTIVLSGDVGVYGALAQVWTNAGTVEGSAYILREGMKQLGTYKDLVSGSVVNPAASK